MTDETKKDSKEESAGVAGTPSMDPVRKWTLIILAVCGVLMIYYVVADRITPYTTQARVNALVVPVAAEVSGRVTEVAVQSNQFVEAGDLLFQIDRERYELAVETAEANLQSARQATGASRTSCVRSRTRFA
jgi:multidrug resistance efflux pump